MMKRRGNDKQVEVYDYKLWCFLEHSNSILTIVQLNAAVNRILSPQGFRSWRVEAYGRLLIRCVTLSSFAGWTGTLWASLDNASTIPNAFQRY